MEYGEVGHHGPCVPQLADVEYKHEIANVIVQVQVMAEKIVQGAVTSYRNVILAFYVKASRRQMYF